MSLFQKILQNPMKIGLERSIKNYFLEKKNANHSKIGYMSLVQGTTLWKYTTIKNEVMLLNSSVGDYTYISHVCNISFTEIWKFCSIGQNFKSWLWEHPTNFVSTHPMFFSPGKQCQVTFADKSYYQEREKVIIGNDVWIGTNVTILDGITIWDGAIIWAGSIVTKDVEPYAIVVGVPARVIRYRFEPDEIAFLLQFRWWDKDVTWMEENYKSFHNMKEFFKKFK